MKYILSLFFLAACAPEPPVFRPVTVDMPVVSPCPANAVALPDFALNHSAPTDDIYTKSKAALIEIDQRKAYEAEIEAQLKACR